MEHTATYSPEDNKIRIYPACRLDADEYKTVRAAGYIWAPKQGLFVAPMWTPEREDLALEMCGEIGDEDKSLVERSEERSERFEAYSEHRAEDAQRSEKQVEAIAGNIPFGQPILVGHHSEKRARRDAQKIENGMRHALKMWDTSRYWEQRAAGAIHHAKYKELPTVRARRIKGLESDKRKQEKIKAELERMLKFWNMGKTAEEYAKLSGVLTFGHISLPRKPEDSPKISHEPSAYDVLNNSYPSLFAPRTLQEVIDTANNRIPGRIERVERWINHINNRLSYEKAMLEESGASSLVEKKPRPAQLPLCNYRAPEGINIESRWTRGDFSTYPQVEMTKEEYSKIYEDHRGTAIVENSHRVRIVYRYRNGERSHETVFLTDQKETPKPEAVKRPEPKLKEPKIPEPREIDAEKEARDAHIAEVRQAVKSGVQTITADELFVTPPELAARMAEEAGIQPENTVLEPSAGTGNIIQEVYGNYNGSFTAVEISAGLVQLLSVRFPAIKIFNRDFLECNGELGTFDRILMNPPFSADIEHVKHAYEHLNDGGRIVAIMGEGAFFRQDKKATAFREWLDECGTSEKLPAGTFKTSGTMVNARIVIIDK